jgi:hypothetical protein
MKAAAPASTSSITSDKRANRIFRGINTVFSKMTCAKIGYSVFFMGKTYKKALLWKVKDAYSATFCIGVLLRYSIRQTKNGATNAATDDTLV